MEKAEGKERLKTGEDGVIQGVVTNVQVYSLHDGPGVRTLVFLKGCGLRCAWCSNPETQRPGAEVEFFESKCIECSACVAACAHSAIDPDFVKGGGFKIYKAACTECGECTKVCPTGALRFVGETVSVEEVMGRVRKDKCFYLSSNGGITVSGGEPLFQFDFTRALLEKAYNENIHTAIETCGHAGWEQYERILPFLDLVLFDVKHMDPAKHREKTGVTNELILDNLRRISEHGTPLVIRIPLIPGFNLDNGNVRATVDYLSGLKGIIEVNLMPFHQFGRDKYQRLCRDYTMEEAPPLGSNGDDELLIEEIKTAYRSAGFTVTVGG